MSKVLGIDLGTTNSVAAVVLGKEAVVIPSAEGERLVPSVVAVNKNHERLVGRLARNQAVVNARNTVFSVKRFMGRRYEDPEVQRTLTRVPYPVLPAANGDVRLRLDGRECSPPEISAMILAKLKQDAEAYLGEPITQAVITVPAYFNDAQRNATREAGQLAGLEVLRIINEPTAAALSYGLDRQSNEIIVVYDLGGGTFDVSILDVGEGVFQVRATAGDTFLGGDDFDQRLMEYLVQEFRRESSIDLRSDPQAMQRLKEAAEQAKIELSTLLQTEINLPYLAANATGPRHLLLTLSRALLEQLTADLIERTMLPVQRAMSDAGLSPAEVDQVILVGGMTRMPAVQKAIRDFFGKEPQRGINPDEVVAIGAALQGGVLAGEVRDILLLDVTPLTLSVETLGGLATPVIERNTTIPTRRSQVFSTASDNQSQVEIHVVQGERPLAATNKSLGRFILDGIPPAPRGVPQIEVTFDIDVNGILKVTARDKSTGRNQQITVTASSGLPKEEIERIRREAEVHAAEDRRRREQVEARNTAESALYAAQGFLNEAGPNLDDESRMRLQAAMETVREAMMGADLTALRQAVRMLNQALQEMQNMPLHDREQPDSAESQ